MIKRRQRPYEHPQGHRRREDRACRPDRNPAAAAEFFRHLADQPDRGCAGGIRPRYRNPLVGAGSARQGVLRRRQFQRSGAAGAGGAREGRSGLGPRPDRPSLRPGRAHLPQQEADRRRRAGRCDRRRAGTCGVGGFPRHLSRGALRRQLHQARLSSRLRADGDASRTGRQEQCRTDFLHLPPGDRRGSLPDGPCQ